MKAWEALSGARFWARWSGVFSILVLGAGFTQAQLVKVMYQQGLNGYASAVDAAISTQNAQFTGGNGITATTTTSGGSTEFFVWKGPEYEDRALLRFENLGIPAGSQVQSVSLQLTFENWDTRTSIQGQYLAGNWNPASAPSNTGLGWLYRDSGLPWAQAGAAGSGTDLLTGKTFTITNFAAQAADIHKVALDTTMVQSWVDNPAANHGVILTGTVTGLEVTRLFSSLNATPSWRPSLTISYWPPGTGPVVVPQAKLYCTPSADRQKMNLNWNSAPGALYQLQWSRDMKTWTTLAPLLVSASAAASWADDGSLTQASPVLQPFRFYRLVTLAQPFFQPTGTALNFQPASPGASYQWDFGDGTTSTAAGAAHTYAVDGSHTVSLSVTDGTGTHAVSCAVSTEAPCRILLTPDVLAGLRQKAAANAPEWQDFQNRLDSRLAKVTGADGAYEGSELELIGDYALGYKVLEQIDPATASGYADKAIGIIKCGLHDYQRNSEMPQQFLARGDGVTTRFTLPNADLEPSSLSVFTGPVETVPITRSATGTVDDVDYYQTFLKVSNTPDGNTDYQQGTDWRHNGDLTNNTLDWTGAAHSPAANTVYYITQISSLTSGLEPVDVTLSGNVITFATAPTADQAIFVQYVYGTSSPDHSTLAWQQTSAGDGGFNSILVDTGYTYRYLGKYLGAGYDWLYDYGGFTPALKAETATMLVRWSDYWRDNGYHKDSPASNYSAGGYVSRMFTALALSGGRDSNGSRLVSEMTAYRQANVVPLLTNAANSYVGGFWAEGWNYGSLAAENLLLGAYAFERAGLGTADAEHQWSGDVINHLVSAQPTQATVYDGGDWYDYPAPFVDKELFYLLGAATTDTTARSHANYIIQSYSGSQSQTMPDLLFRDPSATASFWASDPLQNFARGTGLITARADWSYNSTWVAFQLGNLIDTDHQTYAQGQLQLQRGGDDLLVNVNAMAGNQLISTESSYGNLVAIDDNGRGHQNYSFNEGFWYGTPGCTISSYEATPAYVYAGGSYAAAYSYNQTPGTGTATQLTRQVVYLRPDFVVVHDRASTVEADDPKQLRWHLLNAPVVDASSNSWIATTGSSKLFARTFSSTAINTTSAPVSDPDHNITAYRVSTTPTAAVSGLTWVTALQTAPSTTASMAATASIISTDGRMEGVQMGGNVVLFGTHTTVSPFSGTIGYSVDGSVALTHLVTDLEPNRAYQVMAGSTLIGSLTSSAQGTITFTTPSGAPLAVRIQ